MKNLESAGAIFFVVGLVATFVSATMDATVMSEYGGVMRGSYNIGLLNDRSNYVLISCFVTLIGAIWYGIAAAYNGLVAILKPKPPITHSNILPE